MTQGFPRRTTLNLLFLLVIALAGISCARLPRRWVAADNQSPATTSTQGKNAARVNINTASANEIQELPGIGKVLAERIVRHRRQYGSFLRAEHLMMVRGISDHKFRAIRSFVSVE